MGQPVVLITGGAGFVGINLCRFLIARGYSVRSLDAAPFEHAERNFVDVVRGDIRDVEVVTRAMRGVTAVIHAAAASPSTTSEEVFSTDVSGTWTVLQSAIRNRVPRFIYLSSAAVYGAQTHHLMHEGDPLHGTGPHAEAQIEAEHLCAGARLGGACISVLRLTGVTGAGQGGALAKLYEHAFTGRGFLTLGSGRKPYQILDVEDACEGIHRCLVMRQDLVNDTFNLGARAFGSIHDSFQAVLDRAGHGAKVIAIPRAPTVAALTFFERLTGSVGHSWIHGTTGQDSYLSVRHIGSKLRFQPRFSGTAALLREYDRYARMRGYITPTMCTATQ